MFGVEGEELRDTLSLRRLGSNSLSDSGTCRSEAWDRIWALRVISEKVVAVFIDCG